MARRKSKGKAEAAPQVKARIAVQAEESWIRWVEEGAEFCRTDVSKLVDMALATYLRAQGFPKPPPKRVP